MRRLGLVFQRKFIFASPPPLRSLQSNQQQQRHSSGHLHYLMSVPHVLRPSVCPYLASLTRKRGEDVRGLQSVASFVTQPLVFDLLSSFSSSVLLPVIGTMLGEELPHCNMLFRGHRITIHTLKVEEFLQFLGIFISF